MAITVLRSIFVSLCVSSAPLANASDEPSVREGTVVSVIGPGAFVLSETGSQTIVYYRDAHLLKISPGLQLRVTGSAVDDWAQLGESEILASNVELIPSAAAGID